MSRKPFVVALAAAFFAVQIPALATEPGMPTAPSAPAAPVAPAVPDAKAAADTKVQEGVKTAQACPKCGKAVGECSCHHDKVKGKKKKAKKSDS